MYIAELPINSGFSYANTKGLFIVNLTKSSTGFKQIQSESNHHPPCFLTTHI